MHCFLQVVIILRKNSFHIFLRHLVILNWLLNFKREDWKTNPRLWKCEWGSLTVYFTVGWSDWAFNLGSLMFFVVVLLEAFFFFFSFIHLVRFCKEWSFSFPLRGWRIGGEKAGKSFSMCLLNLSTFNMVSSLLLLPASLSLETLHFTL